MWILQIKLSKEMMINNLKNVKTHFFFVYFRTPCEVLNPEFIQALVW